MTTLVMVQTPGDVILGWDSLSTNGNEQSIMPNPKFFVNNGIVMGVAGRLRALDLLEFAEFPDYDGSEPRQWLITVLDPILRAALSHDPSLFEDDGSLTRVGILIVVGGQAFEYDSSLSPSQSVEGIYTVGSGGDYARGALFLLREMGIGQDEVLDALSAAAAIDTYTGGALFVTQASTYKEIHNV